MKKTAAFFITVAMLVAMVIVSWICSGKSVWLAQFAFLAVAGCLIVILMAVSAAATGKVLGFLINERNLMSLTRLQTILWTVIIVSAYFVIVTARVVMNVPNPLVLEVNSDLWALLGISLTSLVGTSLINSTKTNKTSDSNESTKTARVMVASGNLPKEAAEAAKQADVASPPGLSRKTNEVTPEKADSVATVIDNHKQGTLYANPSINDASWGDMFEGDEVGNAGYIDLAKVQMFFFTVIVGVSYVFVLLATTMPGLAKDASLIVMLPPISQGMLALLGISNAGHLAGKTANRTKLQS